MEGQEEVQSSEQPPNTVSEVEEQKDNNAPEQKEQEESKPNEDRKPVKGAEIFIGGVPHNLTEAELRQIFAEIGEIYSIRYIVDRYTGEGQGYAFVTYYTKEDAEKAVKEFGTCEIKGKKARVVIADPRDRLFIGGIPKHLTKEQLFDEFKEVGDGLIDLEVAEDPKRPGQNRGFCFLEYDFHKNADYCRKKMLSPHYLFHSRHINVTWAEPKTGVNDEIMQKVKSIIVKNISPDYMTEEALKGVFSKFGEVESVIVPKPSHDGKPKDFAFIYFVTREATESALKEMDKKELAGQALSVELARPQEAKTSSRGRGGRGGRGGGRFYQEDRMSDGPRGYGARDPYGPPPSGGYYGDPYAQQHRG